MRHVHPVAIVGAAATIERFGARIDAELRLVASGGEDLEAVELQLSHRSRVRSGSFPMMLGGVRTVVLVDHDEGGRLASNLRGAAELAGVLRQFAPEARVLVACGDDDLVVAELQARGVGSVLGAGTAVLARRLQAVAARHLDVAASQVRMTVLGSSAEPWIMQRNCRVGGVPLEEIAPRGFWDRLGRVDSTPSRSSELTDWVERAVSGLRGGPRRVLLGHARTEFGPLSWPHWVGAGGIAPIALALSPEERDRMADLAVRVGERARFHGIG